MRDKEAVENERKNLTRNLEKQAKLVERLVEVEKSLTSRVVRVMGFSCIIFCLLTRTCRTILRKKLPYVGNTLINRKRRSMPFKASLRNGELGPRESANVLKMYVSNLFVLVENSQEHTLHSVDASRDS